MKALTRLPLALALCLTLSPALATAPAPALVETPTAEPVPVSVPAPQPPARLEGVGATLSIPRTVSGKVPVTLTLQSSRADALKLQAPRYNDQNCVTAPLVRVLRVGTREVVYPAPSEPMLCAQDLRSDTLGARGKVTYTRELNLPAGEYMVEGWWQGFAGDLKAKAPAQPLRITVK